MIRFDRKKLENDEIVKKIVISKTMYNKINK
jgi:hypothetical protein